MNTHHTANPVFRAGRLALILVTAGAALARAQLAPNASTPDKQDETVKLQTFTVTGTNIRRLDQEKTLPVTVLDRDAMGLTRRLAGVGSPHGVAAGHRFARQRDRHARRHRAR